MPVHYAGHPVSMDVLVPWAREMNLKLAEDCVIPLVVIIKGTD